MGTNKKKQYDENNEYDENDVDEIVRVDTPTQLFSRGGNSSNSSNSNAVNKKGNSPPMKKIDIPAVTTSNKAFTHVTPTTFACYPAAFLYKTKKTKKRKKKKFNKNNEDNDLNQCDQDMD